MKIFNFIPNFLTLSNLFFGCVAVVYGVMGDLEKLALFVSLGIICDFFDGFFARLLKVDSKLGVQLDSLSDLVTFGLTSSIVMLNLIGSSSFFIDNPSGRGLYIFSLSKKIYIYKYELKKNEIQTLFKCSTSKVI